MAAEVLGHRTEPFSWSSPAHPPRALMVQRSLTAAHPPAVSVTPDKTNSVKQSGVLSLAHAQGRGCFLPSGKARVKPRLALASWAAAAAAAWRVSSRAWECHSSIDLHSSGSLLTHY